MAVSVEFYNNFIKDMGLQRINFATDVFKVILVYNYTFNPEHVFKSETNGELSTGAGYTNGGATLTGTTWDWNDEQEFTRFDAEDVTWTASAGDIGPATGAIIFDSSTTPTPNRLICYIDFGESELISQDSQFKLTFNTDGVFSITQET